MLSARPHYNFHRAMTQYGYEHEARNLGENLRDEQNLLDIVLE